MVNEVGIMRGLSLAVNSENLPFVNLPTMFATCSDAVSSPCHALDHKKI